MPRGQSHACEDGEGEGQDGQIGDDVDGGGADELGEEGDAFGGWDVEIPGCGYGLALEDVHEGEDGAGDVDDGEDDPGGHAEDLLRVSRQAEVED